MNWDSRIQRFVQSLALASPPRPYRNPYSQPHAAQNLRLFLSRRERLAKTLLLIGEAPGYRGAAISGVPFASAGILNGGWGDPWDAFGPAAGYRTPHEVPYTSEATATIVWRGLSENCANLPLPLTWNALPFHPAGRTAHSNSSVRRADLHVGQPFIEWMLDYAPNAVVVAVGRSAQNTLAALGYESDAIRHPSRGGKNDFIHGITMVTERLVSGAQTRLAF